jgi:aryl-alcohol dehydrogenase-like predicted oxidoreductase
MIRIPAITGATTAERMTKVRGLDELVEERGQTPARPALSWVLRSPAKTAALIGVRRVEQLEENVKALRSPARPGATFWLSTTWSPASTHARNNGTANSKRSSQNR